MRINLHIERLVLDGLPVNGAQGILVQKAIERQLTTLLVNGELHGALRSGGNVHRVQTAGIQLAKETGPAHLGRQIAGAVFGGITK